MMEYIRKLLDEDNRAADIVAFGQLVSLLIAVLVTLLLLIPAVAAIWRTGKIDANAVWILTVWLGSAATFGVADSRRPSTPPTAPSPPAAPTPPTQPTPPVSAPSPQPPPAPGTPGGRTI